MTFTKIAEDVFVVIGGAFPKCNTVVVTADEIVVIDPGCAVEDLRRFLLTQDMVLRDIETIILSHIHPDHITHTMRLNRLSNCRIAANEITAPLFDEKEKMKQFLGFDKGNQVRKLWEQLVNEKMYGAFDEGQVDEVLTDGDKYSLGNITLKTLYTPGHLPDHMCIEILEPNLVFASDIDLTEFGPYYGHPYARQIEIREDLVLSAIIEGAKTVPEITINPIIYPSLTHPVFMQFEQWMVEHHVTSLIVNGLVVEDKGRLSPL